MTPLVRAAVVGALAAAGLLLAPTAPASAHPLGNFTVNTYAGLVVSPGEVRIRYAVDMAEIPTFQEMSLVDADGDGQVTPGERSAWATATAGRLAEDLELSIDGRARPVRLEEATAALRPGQGGLDTLRLDATFVFAADPTGTVAFTDHSFAGRIGWHEVTAVGTDGAAVTGSTVPLVSPSDGLRAYPRGLLSSPLEVREARFQFGPGHQPLPERRPSNGPGRRDLGGDRLTSLVGVRDLSPGVVLAALGVAFAFGAFHALAPGHGKTLIAAYLTGGRGGVRHAIGAGVAVAAMHTASVAGLGLLILSAERLFPAERVYPWLGLAAGAAALVLGGSLLWSRLRGRPAPHGHDHQHLPLSRRGLGALALAGGILPSPTAVVVLISAVVLGRAAFGMALVGAFGIGLATALVAVGLLAIRAGNVVARRLRGRLGRAVPVAAAGAITVMGLTLTAGAAAQL
jgi:ABC-type nickel/cobalt efflux system permease component RcnA